MFKFLKAVFSYFFESNTFQKGAALAYYTVFSILPIIMIITSVFGILFGEQAVTGEIYLQLKEVLGKDAAMEIQDIIKNQQINHNSVLTSIIGFATLAFSASIMFSQIHNSFNSIWNIKEKPKSGILKYLTKQLFSFIILISLFLILLLSTMINSLLVKYAHVLHDDYRLSYMYEHLASFFVISLIFSIMFKFLGDAKVNWKPALLGGLFTSLFFMLGKIGIGLYIGNSNISSTFGSTSALAILMLWVYYTSQIIFLGASFVKIISDEMNVEIVASDEAVLVESKEIEN